MKRAFAFLIVFLLLAGLAGGLAWFQFVQKPEMIRGFIAAAPQPLAAVAVAEAKTEEWQTRLPAIGTFRAVQGIDVSPQVGGVVRAIRFDSGQDVERGHVLVQIDDLVEQADLKSNLATLRNAELSLERQKQLVSGGSTTTANVDLALSQRDSAAAAADRTRALIAQKQLIAPFAGRLGLRKVDVGQYVSPGTSIVTLQQLDPIDVDFPMPEQDIGKLQLGQAVDLSVDAYPGKVYSDKIGSIDARVSAETRTIIVRAQVANPARELRPGMFANVGVLAGQPVKITTIPRTSVSYSLYGDTIFVVKPAPPPAGSAQAATPPADQPLIVERRVVRTGDTRADRIEIRDGVAPGERVVTEGQLKLQPNARVKIDPNAGLQAPATLPRQ
ncbi:MAG: efflux RND transporter periplasmic adaptor subunit [Beijerinckiaceae bacterium]|nr:efflux RND transporter periplasmic adaptor subunit [Beijerinckiaceae bacterium]